MGDASRSKNVIAGMRLEGLIADLKDVLTLENQPRLILSLVDVQPDAGSRIVGGFDQSVSTACLLAAGHKRLPAVAHSGFFAAQVRHESRKQQGIHIHPHERSKDRKTCKEVISPAVVGT